jgi:ATP-dependent helicase Lhr and Lhr-like helicase
VAPRDSGQVRWWTWAGARANASLAAVLAAVQPDMVEELDRYDNRYIKLRGDATAGALRQALQNVRARFGVTLDGVDAGVNDEAVKQLKFAELLPPALASATLAAREHDGQGCAAALTAGVVSQSG